ncbi:MAG: GC-type dockerin domain-anchored protein, partial [Planctomyces sp.]
NALTALPNGDLIAGGSFFSAGGVTVNRIARWNGSAWSALGTGMNNEVTALTTLPNGDLIASGLFTNAGGVPANRIARWNGSAWSSLGSGLNGTASALTTLPSGDLIAGGGFTTAVGIVAPYLARWGCQPPAACNPADLANTDGEPGADGAVDNGDFNAFFIAFFATEGDPLRAAADISSTDGDTVLTGGGPDGTVDNGDFNAFFLYFFQGCP